MTTGSPVTVATSVRVVRKSCPPREVISSMTVTQVRRSPAYTGRGAAYGWTAVPATEAVKPSAQGRQDSNLQPAVLETAALPIAPHPFGLKLLT